MQNTLISSFVSYEMDWDTFLQQPLNMMSGLRALLKTFGGKEHPRQWPAIRWLQCNIGSRRCVVGFLLVGKSKLNGVHLR